MRNLAGRIGVAVLLGLAASRAEAVSLRDRLAGASQTVGLASGSAFDALADVIADTAARSIPVVSASAGFTYRFNPQLEVFERTSETLGPIFLERPDTLGQSKININVSFQYVQFDAFDGTSLRRLEAPDPIVTRVVGAGGALLGFTANQLQYRLRIQDYVTALSVTYGVLDNLDANLLIPLIQTNFSAGVTSQQRFLAGPDGIFAPSPGPPLTGSTKGDTFGVGDLLLRFKYQLPQLDFLKSAAGLQLRLPSGREEDFQGVGSFEASPSFFASTVLWSRVEPYVNGAIDLLADDVGRSQARYGVGLDVDATQRLGLAFAFLGRSEFEREAPSGETDFLHLVNGKPALRPLLGIDFARHDFVDFSFGARTVVWRGIMVFANGIYALNDAGLRNDTIIPTVGFEGTF